MKHALVIVVIGLLLVACSEQSTSRGPTFSQIRATETASAPTALPTQTALPTPVKRTVVYRVIRSTAKGGTGVTYNNAQGGTEQRTFGNRDWERKVVVDDGFFAYISAQNRNPSGSITCQIVVDGVVWRESKSTGSYSIATCSGSIGRE